MAHYWYGEDTYEARQHLNKLPAAETTWLTEKASVTEIEQALEAGSQSLFGQQRVVITNPSKLPSAAQETLIEKKAALPDHIILWDQEQPKRSSKFFKRFQKKSRQFTSLSATELQKWALSYATEHGTTLTADAAQKLIASFNGNRWRLAHEIERLALTYNNVAGTDIEDTVVSAENEIFQALQAISEGRAREAWAHIERLLHEGASHIYLLTMCAYQYRVLTLIKQGMQANLAPEEIARTSKLHPFVVKKNIPVARRLTHSQLVSALARIGATEYAVKQRRIDPDTALVMLVIALASAATAPKTTSA